MRKFEVFFVAFLLIFNSLAFARTVSFTKYIVESNVNAPHGDWAGDVNNDNPVRALDAFATIVLDKQVAWYSNLTLGTAWGPRNVIYTSDRYVYEVSASDLDGDGWVDAVASCVQSDSVAYSFLVILRNNQNGTFTPTVLDTVKARLRQTRLEDVNNDGKKDIIVAGSAPRASWIQESGVYWFQNNSTVGNISFTKHFIGTCDAWKCDVYDDEPDGHLEIVVTEEFFGSSGTSPARMILYKNIGTDVFTQSVVETNLGLNLGDPPGGGGVRAADLDGDLKTDLIAGSSYNGVLYWYKNNGGSAFTRNTIDAMAGKIDGIDVGDFEQDGDIDIVACGRDYWIAWYENDSTGNFTKHVFDVQWRLFDLPFVTYLDGDTCPDIIVTEATSSTGHVLAYLNNCLDGSVEEDRGIPHRNWIKASSIIGNKSGRITFGIENEGKIKLEVFDITGKLVDIIIPNNYYQAGTYSAEWKVKDIPNGIYILRFKLDENSIISKKITVVR